MKESNSKSFFDGDIVLPHAAGDGIQFGVYGSIPPTYGWHVLNAPFIGMNLDSPMSGPTWTRVGSTAFWAYKFAIGNNVWQSYVIPHDIVPGSSIYFQVRHMSPQASPLDTGYVTFKHDWMYAKGHNQATFDPTHATSPLVNSGVVYSTGAVSTTSYRNMTITSAAVAVTGLTEPGGTLYTQLGRVANQTSPLNSVAIDVLVLGANILYQSTGVPTKQKAHDYYAA